MCDGATAIVTFLLVEPAGPLHVMVKVVVVSSGGVVYEPAVALMPPGEEEQDVLLVDDHEMMAVALGAINSGVADADIEIKLGLVEPLLFPPHEVIKETTISMTTHVLANALDLTASLFDKI